MPTYPAKVAREGATHLWRLDELAGVNAADAIGGKAGTYAGDAVLGVAGPPAVACAGALRLAGAGSVDFANGAGMPAGAVDWTIDAWVRESDQANGKAFIDWGDNAGNAQAIALLGWWFGNPLAYLSSFNDSVEFATPPRPPGWHHVALTYEAAAKRCRCYVDGVEGANSPLIKLGPLNLGAAGLRIGRLLYAGNWPWTGDLSHVAVYPSVLSAPLIADHAAGDDPFVPAFTPRFW